MSERCLSHATSAPMRSRGRSLGGCISRTASRCSRSATSFASDTVSMSISTREEGALELPPADDEAAAPSPAFTSLEEMLPARVPKREKAGKSAPFAVEVRNADASPTLPCRDSDASLLTLPDRDERPCADIIVIMFGRQRWTLVNSDLI